MRRLLMGLTLGLAVATAAGSAGAAQAPAVGPKSSWSDNQKFEWYLGHMSQAAAICRDYDAAKQLSEIAALSPYGKLGLKSIGFDSFSGAACGGIRKDAKELLQKKDAYLRYMNATY